MHNLFVLYECLATQREAKSGCKPTFAAFIDLKGAYDSVWRKGLWWKLWNVGVRGNLWRCIHGLFDVQSKCVLIPSSRGSTTPLFPSLCGLAQGAVLSPALYNLFQNELEKELLAAGCTGITISSSLSVGRLYFADDIVILAPTARELRVALAVAQNFFNKWRLTVNVPKSAVMIFYDGRREGTRSWLRREETTGFPMGDALLPVVKSYKYLGLELTSPSSSQIFDRALTQRIAKSH